MLSIVCRLLRHKTIVYSETDGKFKLIPRDMSVIICDGVQRGDYLTTPPAMIAPSLPYRVEKFPCPPHHLLIYLGKPKPKPKPERFPAVSRPEASLFQPPPSYKTTNTSNGYLCTKTQCKVRVIEKEREKRKRTRRRRKGVHHGTRRYQHI